MFSIRSNSRVKQALQRIIKNKPFINKYSWEGTNYPSKKVIGKKLGKII